MQFDQELVSHKLKRWDAYIQNYRLPEWEAIPDFGLYMDQVVALTEQYLDFIPTEKERFVTPSTINNYVRLKVMPAPAGRKYYRLHIAYLLIILTLKQSLSISDIHRVIPPDISVERLQIIYGYYCRIFHNLSLFFIRQVQSGDHSIRSAPEGLNGAELLVVESALIAGFSRILAEKLIRLDEADPERVLAAEQQESTPPSEKKKKKK